MHRLLLLLAAIIFSPAVPAEIEFLTGNDLQPECAALLDAARNFQEGKPIQSPEQRMKASNCLSYLAGVIETNVLHAGLTGKAVFCPPDDLDLMEIAKVVTKYMEENPQRQRDWRTMVVHMALAEAYPCKPEPR